MDWALKAAKKRLKNQAGGSRSIVESLNELNDVMLNGHKDAESIFYRSNDWLNMEMTKLGYPRAEHVTALVSPEKSVYNEDQSAHEKPDEQSIINDGMEVSQRENTDKDENSVRKSGQSSSINPDPVPDAKTNFEQESLESGIKVRTEDPDNNHTNFNQQLIMQPAITPKSLLGDDTARLFPNSSSMKKASQEPSVSKSSPWPVQKDTKDSSATGEPNASVTQNNWGSTEENHTAPAMEDKFQTESVTKSIRDRSQRRSNMFVPLPSKNPLIVQPTPNQQKRKINASATLPIQQEKKLKVMPSPLPAATSQSKSKSPRYAGNVFERLSNNLTESFERKGVDRRMASPLRNKRSTTSPTRSQRSGASIHGSPTSRKLTHNNSHTDRIHHTLKNIFDSKIPELPKIHDKVQPLRRRVSNLIDRSNPTERKSLIPRIKELTPVKNVREGTNTRLTHEAKIVSKNSSPADTRRKHVESQLPIPKSPSTSPTSSDHRTNSHDRLTKFQLVTGTSSNRQEKDTLKQKLNKRLSEVMRNQQEQHMRKKFELQQRRVSQAEEDSKRRTKILLDHNYSKLPTLSKTVSTNSILHDINTTDYREHIGVASKTEEPSNDVTLPEIVSDDESNDEVERTLTSWAEPNRLKKQLLLQQSWDIEQILGPIPTLHIDEIFLTNSSRLQKLKKR